MTVMNLSSRQFRNFCELVYNACGINLHEGKQQLLQARLSKRLRQTGIESVDEYLALVRRDPDELTRFLDAVSTNHTFFFRECHHFEHLRPHHLTIWCAAASSGEEPYSVAIHCAEKGFRPTILATDISTRVLQIGRNGIYPLERAKSLPPQLLRKYFQKGLGNWKQHIKIKAEIRSMVNFQRINLVADPPPPGRFDVIFCRNVLIYFDNRVKTLVVSKLFDALKPAGLLIIGGAESLNTIAHPFKYLQPSIYLRAA